MTLLNLFAATSTLPEPSSGTSACAQDAVIALTDVHKSYGQGAASTRVLDGCNLTVCRGECVFLMGPSGSGKTTLLSIIGCVLRPDQGAVRIMGRDVLSLSPAAAADLRRTHIGFVFQRYHLIRGLSVLENVCLPLTLDGVVGSGAERRARDLLGWVGLADQAHRQPKSLSVGQCQRVALARALAADPPLVLADEPTAALDAELGQQAMQLLRRLTVELGKTAVVVTHDPRILSYADRIFVMERGRLTPQQ